MNKGDVQAFVKLCMEFLQKCKTLSYDAEKISEDHCDLYDLYEELLASLKQPCGNCFHSDLAALADRVEKWYWKTVIAEERRVTNRFAIALFNGHDWRTGILNGVTRECDGVVERWLVSVPHGKRSGFNIELTEQQYAQWLANEKSPFVLNEWTIHIR